MARTHPGQLSLFDTPRRRPLRDIERARIRAGVAKARLAVAIGAAAPSPGRSHR
jgi:hypothetical protein